MFWMIASAQEKQYGNNPSIQKYGTKPYFIDVVSKLDEAYELEPLNTPQKLISFIEFHPKLTSHYQLDPKHQNLKLWTV